MSKWFRFYSDAMRNPKVAALSDREFRLWVSLMAVASENDGSIPPAAELKHVLNARLDHLLTGLERLISGGLIDRLAHGYEPHHWSKFQYKSDSSTERVAKHRSKGNVSVTPPDTETEQRQKELQAAQQSVAPPAALRNDVLDRLLEAAGVKGNPPTGLAFPGPILGLIDAGYDLEADILPAIRAKPNPRVRTWGYFVPQIQDAVASRKAIAAQPRPVAATINWSGRLDVFSADGTWGNWGPRPGESGCQVPPELLRKQVAA